MRVLAVVVAMVLTGCASAPTGHRAGPKRHVDLAADKAEVEAVQQRLRVERRASEDALEAAARAMTADQHEGAFDELTLKYDAKEQAALQPLANRGNSEALFQLSLRLRDATGAEDVGRWFELVNAAAAQGHRDAELELNRWYWHQRGSGSLQDVQRNRFISMEYADRAAGAGGMFAIRRLAIYVSGSVHQYPPNLELAWRLLELCAETDDQQCQELLVGQGPYDDAHSPARTYFWLHRLADRQPGRFSEPREAAFHRLSEDEKASLPALAALWRPTSWRSLRPQWRDIREKIMAYGETSVGPDVSCSTATPWCRGRLLKLTRR